MQSAIERDERFRPITLVTKILYALFSAWLVISGVLSALCALSALSLVVGVFAGFSWSLSVGLAAVGFALDSLYCALNGTNI